MQVENFEYKMMSLYNRRPSVLGGCCVAGYKEFVGGWGLGVRGKQLSLGFILQGGVAMETASS